MTNITTEAGVYTPELHGNEPLRLEEQSVLDAAMLLGYAYLLAKETQQLPFVVQIIDADKQLVRVYGKEVSLQRVTQDAWNLFCSVLRAPENALTLDELAAELPGISELQSISIVQQINTAIQSQLRGTGIYFGLETQKERGVASVQMTFSRAES